jgi:hypothetical protein
MLSRNFSINPGNSSTFSFKDAIRAGGYKHDADLTQAWIAKKSAADNHF